MKIGIKNLPNKSKRPLVFFLPESDFERTIIQEIQNLNIRLLLDVVLFKY